jgi:hypothetical protein
MRTSQKIGVGALVLIAVATVVAIKNPMPHATTFTSSSSNEPDIMPPEMRRLSSAITLKGVPCGDVRSARRVGDDDIIGTCTNGLSYRLYSVTGGYLLQRANEP